MAGRAGCLGLPPGGDRPCPDGRWSRRGPRAPWTEPSRDSGVTTNRSGSPVAANMAGGSGTSGRGLPPGPPASLGAQEGPDPATTPNYDLSKGEGQTSLEFHLRRYRLTPNRSRGDSAVVYVYSIKAPLPLPQARDRAHTWPCSDFPCSMHQNPGRVGSSSVRNWLNGTSCSRFVGGS